MKYETAEEIMGMIRAFNIDEDSVVLREGTFPPQSRKGLNRLVNEHRKKIGIEFPNIHATFGGVPRISLITKEALVARYIFYKGYCEYYDLLEGGK